MGEHRHDNGFAAIRGPCRISANAETGSPVGQTEAPQSQVSLQLDRMLAAGLISPRIVGEHGGRQAELMGHESDHGFWRLLGGSQAETWIS